LAPATESEFELGYNFQWWGTGKGKAITLQACTGPEGSRSLEFQDFKSVGT